MEYILQVYGKNNHNKQVTAGELGLKDLDREGLAEADVIGLVHDPHATRAELADEAVLAVEHRSSARHYARCHENTVP